MYNVLYKIYHRDKLFDKSFKYEKNQNKFAIECIEIFIFLLLIHLLFFYKIFHYIKSFIKLLNPYLI